MWLPLAAEELDPWTAWWNGVWGWFGGWWHVETLGPDLLVGVVTGAVVGLIVLKYEKRASARSRQREITDTQTLAVDDARSALRFDIHFFDDNGKGLHVDQSLLGRVLEAVDAVPAGTPSEHVPGYHWVQRLASSVAEVEALADALDERIAEHDRKGGNSGTLAIWTKKNIRRLSESDSGPGKEWWWSWHDQLRGEHTRSVEEDTELRGIIRLYVLQRRLVHAYRKAFLKTMEYLRTEESSAIWEQSRTHGGRIRRSRAQRKADSRIEASKVWADLQAIEIVSQVDPNAV